MKRVVPGAGARRVAALLAKASLHVSARSVRRFLDTRDLLPKPPGPLTRAAEIARSIAATTVAARYPHHVWGVDFTTVAIAGGRWAGWLGKILPQQWPFCWWVTVVVDYHSRTALAVVATKQAPTTEHMTQLLARLSRRHGPPRYVVTDRGSQFGADYVTWCTERHIHARFGAVGRKGSIAIVERFIRSLKEEAFGRGRWTSLSDAWMRAALMPTASGTTCTARIRDCEDARRPKSAKESRQERAPRNASSRANEEQTRAARCARHPARPSPPRCLRFAGASTCLWWRSDKLGPQPETKQRSRTRLRPTPAHLGNEASAIAPICARATRARDDRPGGLARWS